MAGLLNKSPSNANISPKMAKLNDDQMSVMSKMIESVRSTGGAAL